MPENTAAEAPTWTLRSQATDADVDDIDLFKLNGLDAGSFTIDRMTQAKSRWAPGRTWTTRPRQSYTVTVTATDPARVSVTITVTIMVTDVNENAGDTRRRPW